MKLSMTLKAGFTLKNQAYTDNTDDLPEGFIGKQGSKHLKKTVQIKRDIS